MLSALFPILGKTVGKLMIPLVGNVIAAQFGKSDPNARAAWVKDRGKELIASMVSEGDIPATEPGRAEDYIFKIITGIVALFKLIGLFQRNPQTKT